MNLNETVDEFRTEASPLTLSYYERLSKLYHRLSIDVNKRISKNIISQLQLLLSEVSYKTKNNNKESEKFKNFKFQRVLSKEYLKNVLKSVDLKL